MGNWQRKTTIWQLLLVASLCFVLTLGIEINKASQCFKSPGIPKVAFQCDTNNMIKIHRAFHGIAVRNRNYIEPETCSPSPGQRSLNCTQCEGDCIDDSMNLVYDWSTCMGNVSCIRTVMQSYMPSCKAKDKFSDYLQVEYQCIPRDEVIDVCSTVDKWVSEGYIMSPNYPYNYPPNQNCLCNIQTDWNTKIVLSFYDLLLETKNGRCRADWLMLRQKGQKHRHCGAIMTGIKNITSATNAVSIQFHSDENDNRTQNFQYFTRNLKGFWLYFTGQPDNKASLHVTCRKLSKQDLEVKEIMSDDREYEEIVSTQTLETTTRADATKTKENKQPGDGTLAPPSENEPGRKRPGRPNDTHKGPKKGSGRENEVDFQQKGSGAASSQQFNQVSAALAFAGVLTLQLAMTL